MKPAAIVIFTHKAELDWYEEIALRQCGEVLGRHPIFLILPEGVSPEAHLSHVPQLTVLPISKKWFGNVRTYNRLKLWPGLYTKFKDYEYMLTYELDAFVFRDELAAWCDAGWDYIGAPWFDGVYNVSPDSPFTGVGNSGFSLRRISSVLKVLHDWRYVTPPMQVLRDPRWIRHRWPKSWLAKAVNITTRNRFHWAANIYRGNEDFFWGLHADRRFDWWHTADYESACKFSFEANAPRLYRETGRLPFGCHKWNEVHSDFWRSHIEAYGYSLPDNY